MDIKTFEEAISFEQLWIGAKKSCRNVMWKDSVVKFSLSLSREVHSLRKSLLDGSYKISPYQIFSIHEPKEREIVATRVRDRAFQRSLCDNILTPAITRSFIYDNCACHVGKGITFALDRMNHHLHKYYRESGCDGYVLQCDIHHFFPETPHDVAKAAVRKRVKDDMAYKYTVDIIDSFGSDRGIGLGSQVSQLIQLAVLDDLDHFIKEKLHIKHYIRYMDDFILIHEDKAYLQYCLNVIKEKLFEMGLTLNKKTCIYKLSQGIVFLKWRFILTRTGKVLRKLSKASSKRERSKLKKLIRKVSAGIMPLGKYNESYTCLNAYAKHGNTSGARSNMHRLYLKQRKGVTMILNKELVAARVKQRNDVMELAMEKFEAFQEYIAMMADIELPEDEVEVDENV